MSTNGKAATAPDLARLLEERYPANEYALLPQVRNGTGFSKAPRTADAMAIGLWPSRGLYVHGFEIKVTRADWIRELRAPEKAEDIARYCDFWWLVVPDIKIAPIDEVPASWGILAPDSKGKLRATRNAEKLEAQPLDRLFVAAILRKAANTTTPRAAFQKEYQRGYNEGRAAGHKDGERSAGYSAKELEELREAVKAFEDASGVRINQWSDPNLGAVVKLVLDARRGQRRDVVAALDRAQEWARKLEDALEEIARADETSDVLGRETTPRGTGVSE